MSHKRTPEPEDRTPETKSSQQLLLVVLSLLVAVFGYLYFFTGLIRPRPEPPPPQEAQGVLKRRLPPRPKHDLEEVKTGEKSAAKKSTPAPKGKDLEAAAVPAQTSGVSAKEKGVKAQAVKAPAPHEEKGRPAEKGAKPSEAKGKLAKGEVAGESLGAKKGAAKEAKAQPSAKEKAPANEGKPVQKPKVALEKVAPEKVTSKRASKPVSKPTAPPAAALQKKAPAPAGYVLELTGDLAESEVGPVSAKLKEAGLPHVATSKVTKGEKVHRLFLADFSNHDEAAEELQRLKENAPDAFLLKENGRYLVYAGSYLREKKAALEQDRLYDMGIKLLMRTANAPVSVFRLRAGRFAERQAAKVAAERLKKAGVEAKVVKTGK